MSRLLAALAATGLALLVAAAPAAAEPAPPTTPAPSRLVQPELKIPSPLALVPDAMRMIFSRDDD